MMQKIKNWLCSVGVHTFEPVRLFSYPIFGKDFKPVGQGVTGTGYECPNCKRRMVRIEDFNAPGIVNDAYCWSAGLEPEDESSNLPRHVVAHEVRTLKTKQTSVIVGKKPTLVVDNGGNSEKAG